LKRIRGGSGLGDAIYQRPIAEHFVRLGEQVVVCSDQPDVFTGSCAEVQPFRRDNIDVLAHYVGGKNNPNTNQWQDVCASAGVDVPLSFQWTVKNQAMVEDFRHMAAGKPVVLVHGGRAPMARTDGFGAELLPQRHAFDAALDALQQDCFLIEVGKGTELYPLRADIDLNGRTSVHDLFDLAWMCDAVVGQCSFVVPLAECFDKPLLAIWAAHGMQANRHPYIKAITPQKILSKPTSTFVVDDWPVEQIQEVVRAFCPV
jgi:hypothetical protein